MENRVDLENIINLNCRGYNRNKEESLMGIKEQFMRIKENWLILLLVLVFLFAASGSDLFSNIASSRIGYSAKMGAMPESAVYQERAYYPAPSGDFSPEVKERKITKTAYLSTEVERGDFKEAEAKLKDIVSSSGSYLLNEDVNKYGTKRKSYYAGNYQIKAESTKYDAIISQLKKVGEVQSFNENTRDITGTYTDAETELEAEKARLKRYESMYDEAKDIKDKIELNDRIFNQERTIKYLEDSLKNIGQTVDYSAIYFTINEKQSEYADAIFVKFSELIQNLVGSFNTLIKWIFVLLPWAAAALIIGFAWKRFKRK